MNTNQPLVSVIIPSYNHEKYVGKTIMSVINQTYENIELIIIDDGSKDGSPYVIKELLNRVSSRKIMFEIQDNMGLCKTLNKAIRMANGEFISILASDDMYLANRIEKCMDIFSNAESNVCAVYSNGFIINEDGMKICRLSDKCKIPIGKDMYKELLVENWISAPSVLYKKSCLFECGLFDENIQVEDYDMSLKLAHKYKYIYIKEPLVLYRWHGLNYSKNRARMEEQLWIISKKYKELYSFRKFMFAFKNRKFIELFYEFNFLNIELLVRAIIRKVQKIIAKICHRKIFVLMKSE